MPVADILQQIVKTKKGEIVAARQRVPESALRQRIAGLPGPRDFFAAVTKPPIGLANVIAEVKKASPSAGVMKADFDPIAIAHAYHAAGADALSILTDESYFHGHLTYLKQVREAVPLPCLRKDFMIDPYQIDESRAAGADAILLIAEILSDAQFTDLHARAAELHLTVLVEVHELESLHRVRNLIGFPLPAATLLGINNRDLRTFTVDLSTTLRLAASVETKNTLVAESGIRDHADVQRLNSAGVKTLLIGETLMRSGDIGGTMAALKGVAPA